MNFKVTFFIILSFLFIAPAFSEEEEHHDHEEEVNISQDILSKKEISIHKVESGEIKRTFSVNGRVSANRNRLAHIYPRFSGIVHDIRKDAGENVKKGETLAVVESNQSLQRYEISSLTDGTVLYRHATIGEYVDETKPIFVVADLSTVWIELFIFPTNFPFVTLNQKVVISLPSSTTVQTGVISFLSKTVDETSQSKIGRVVLSNQENLFYPEQFVNARIVTDAVQVKSRVLSSALQTIENRTALFIKEHDGFKAVPVVTGQADDEYTEILSGVSEGDEYAAGNTFLLKAELQKSSAEHEH